MAKPSFKKIFLFLFIFILICLGFTFYANYQVNTSTKKQLYSDVNQIPYNKVGLLLGASRTLRSGQPNDYFYNRINAAVKLFNAHKIDYIIVSGDNGIKTYNEPLDMKNALTNQGVPAERIFLDYAGFRTYDSVIRAREIFGQQSITVISQGFHNQRAVYIANKLGIKAIAFNAVDVNSYKGFKTQLREKLARVKVFIDLAIGKEPKFLGEKVII